jgi:segregation and condensation protein B
VPTEADGTESTTDAARQPMAEEQADQRSGSDEVLDVEALLEALLFVADAPVPVHRLAETLDVGNGSVEDALERLELNYRDRGLRLQRDGQDVQLVSAPQAAAAIERFLGLETLIRLSPAALETAAIIAYRQPITRPEIESIRGVGSDSVLRTLLSGGLIEEVGRAPTVGRPILYGTTFEFLQHFGLETLDTLPPLDQFEVDEIEALQGAGPLDGEKIEGQRGDEGRQE